MRYSTDYIGELLSKAYPKGLSKSEIYIQLTRFQEATIDGALYRMEEKDQLSIKDKVYYANSSVAFTMLNKTCLGCATHTHCRKKIRVPKGMYHCDRCALVNRSTSAPYEYSIAR